MKKLQNLATVFAVIAREGAGIESKADVVLRIVKSKKLKTLPQFNAAVRDAYRANGWNAAPGKPKLTEKKLESVPASVKQYVSAIRGALRLKLLVTSYSSFYALRDDLKKQRAKLRQKTEDKVKPELVGVTLHKPEQLTGALFHDLAALYGALDRKRQAMMEGALDRVKRQFASAAPQLVVAEERKAA